MNEIQQKKIIIKGLLTNYYTFNSQNNSINLVLLHGWLSNANVFKHLMHAFSKVNINVYALDLPGFGESQIPNFSVNNNFYAEVIKEFIDKLNLQSVVLAGHSNGGAISTKYITKYGNIDKLILISSSGIRKGNLKKSLINLGAKIVKPIFALPFLKPIRLKIYQILGYDDYINSSYLKDTYKNIISDDISDLYKSINIPTLIIWGDKDKSTPLDFANFIHANIKSSDLYVISAGHFPFVDKPNEVINLIVNFLKK